MLREQLPKFGSWPTIRPASGKLTKPSPTPAGTAIVLLGDQTPVPAENRVRRDDACLLTQDPPAVFLAAHRESPALGVGQTKRSRTKMLPEDAILLPEIVDTIFLVASHPASQSQHEEVQSVGHGRRLHGSDATVTHVVSGIHSPRPFSRTIRDLDAAAQRLNSRPRKTLGYVTPAHRCRLLLHRSVEPTVYSFA